MEINEIQELKWISQLQFNLICNKNDPFTEAYSLSFKNPEFLNDLYLNIELEKNVKLVKIWGNWSISCNNALVLLEFIKKHNIKVAIDDNLKQELELLSYLKGKLI